MSSYERNQELERLRQEGYEDGFNDRPKRQHIGMDKIHYDDAYRSGERAKEAQPVKDLKARIEACKTFEELKECVLDVLGLL